MWDLHITQALNQSKTTIDVQFLHLLVYFDSKPTTCEWYEAANIHHTKI